MDMPSAGTTERIHDKTCLSCAAPRLKLEYKILGRLSYVLCNGRCMTLTPRHIVQLPMHQSVYVSMRDARDLLQAISRASTSLNGRVHMGVSDVYLSPS